MSALEAECLQARTAKAQADDALTALQQEHDHTLELLQEKTESAKLASERDVHTARIAELEEALEQSDEGHAEVLREMIEEHEVQLQLVRTQSQQYETMIQGLRHHMAGMNELLERTIISESREKVH